MATDLKPVMLGANFKPFHNFSPSLLFVCYIFSFPRFKILREYLHYLHQLTSLLLYKLSPLQIFFWPLKTL